MHIFITGGTGFFGKALLRHWASGSVAELAGARLTLLSRNPVLFRAKHGALLEGLNARLVEGDIQRPETLPGEDYTHILHAATDSTTGLSVPPLQRFEQIVDGTRNMLDLALRCGLPRVLLTSSGGVYGPQPSDLAAIPETFNGMPDPLDAYNAYSVGKRMAEHLAALYHDAHGLQTVVARCFTFVGQDLPLDAHFAIGNFMRDALAGRDIVVQGDGTPVRSYLDQRDLAHWLTAMLLRGQAQRTYNVGSDDGITIGALARKIATMTPGSTPKVRILKQVQHDQASQRNYYVPDVKRAKNELGLCVSIGLDEAIRAVMATQAGTSKGRRP